MIIGILATLTIIAFNGVSHKAKEAAVRSEAGQIAHGLGAYNAVSTNYPTNPTDAGVRTGDSRTLSYETSPDQTAYCAAVSDGDISYKVSNSNSTPTPGTCEWTVSTFAGGTTAGTLDGSGGSAQFGGIFGMAIDSSGNIYTADRNTNHVRKVTPSGVVTTLAGSTAGSADGTGSAAQFNYPVGVAVDASGNVYVADYNNSCIRKITPSGVVTTFAGSVSGYADGTGTAAKFTGPSSIAIDGAGNLYVSDASGNRIRKVTPGGVVTTIAGSGAIGSADGTGTAAQFNKPDHIAIGPDGNLYVADTYNNRIRKVTPGGVVTTIAGSGVASYADGTGTAAQFNLPYGLNVDSLGNLFIADLMNNRIRKITVSGVVTTIAGTGDQGTVDGPAMSAQFAGPRGLVVDSARNVYIGDMYAIRKLTPPYSL